MSGFARRTGLATFAALLGALCAAAAGAVGVAQNAPPTARPAAAGVDRQSPTGTPARSAQAPAAPAAAAQPQQQAATKSN